MLSCALTCVFFAGLWYRRSITLLLGSGIFALSIFSVTLLPSEFVPATDSEMPAITWQNTMPVPLGVVANMAFSEGPGEVSRSHRKVLVTIEANLAPDVPPGTAVEAIYALPLASNMPSGTAIEQAGDAEVMGDVFSSFGLAMGADVLLVLTLGATKPAIVQAPNA